MRRAALIVLTSLILTTNQNVISSQICYDKSDVMPVYMVIDDAAYD